MALHYSMRLLDTLSQIRAFEFDSSVNINMASSTLDRRVSVLLVNDIIVVCTLIGLTFYTVSTNLKLTDSMRNLESKVQELKAKDNIKTMETRQKFERLGRGTVNGYRIPIECILLSSNRFNSHCPAGSFRGHAAIDLFAIWRKELRRARLILTGLATLGN